MRDDIRDGLKKGLGISLAVLPFGLLFGALAVDNGLTPFEAVLMSGLLYAGASQMVGLELFGQNVAPWLIVLSIFAVNFRHVLYSAAIRRHIIHYSFGQKAAALFLLVDPQYAESESRAEKGKAVSLAWYMGMGLPIYAGWLVETWIGAAFGKLITNPQALALDFLLPIYFLGLVMGFRKRPLWLPVVLLAGGVSVIAYLTVGSPWHVSIGAIAGVALAAALPPKPTASAPEPLEAGP